MAPPIERDISLKDKFSGQKRQENVLSLFNINLYIGFSMLNYTIVSRRLSILKQGNKMRNIVWNRLVKPVLWVTFGTKKKWPHKTGDLLKEVQFI
jgi:hypothetical protein